jgi:hypothetical protein
MKQKQKQMVAYQRHLRHRVVARNGVVQEKKMGTRTATPLEYLKKDENILNAMNLNAVAMPATIPRSRS